MLVNALQHCRLKAFFQLRGEAGAQCGYEKLLIEQRANAQRNAIEKIRREYSKAEVATDLKLSVADFRKGAAFILGARLDDDRYAVVFDALRKTDGSSMLGDFRYQPVLFCADATGLRFRSPTARGARGPFGAGPRGTFQQRTCLSWARQRENRPSFRVCATGCGNSFSEMPNACNESKGRRSCS